MKQTMDRRIWIGGTLLAIVTVAIALVIFARRPVADSGDAEWFKKTLIDAVNQADEICVTEHSDESDFRSSGEEWSGKLPSIEYQSVVLSPAQKTLLIAETAKMSSISERWLPGCGPEIHHTFQFVRKSGETATMEVCFYCGKIIWEGRGIIEPEDGLMRLAGFLERIGMHPRQDWAKLGKERIKSMPGAPHEIR